ncbi:MAG: membrane protein insertase YidC, partial [Bacteroidota bacterium]
MEEKKLDINSIIGFILIFGILIFWMYQNQPTPEELEAQKKEHEEAHAHEEEEESKPALPILSQTPINTQDSTAVAEYKKTVGDFGFTKATDGTTLLENEVLQLEVSNRGGQIVLAKMKNFVTND